MDGIKKFKVGDLRDLLQQYHREDDIMVITSARKVAHITGINEELSAIKRCIVLRLDYDEAIREAENKMFELEQKKERIDEEIKQIDLAKVLDEIRERRKEDKEVKDLDRDEVAKVGAVKKGRGRPKKEEKKDRNLDPRELLSQGLIPVAGRGRPRKIRYMTPTRKKLLKLEKLKEMTNYEIAQLIEELNKEWITK